MIRENLFAGRYLDRRAEARQSADWLSEALSDAQTRFLLMQGSGTLMQLSPEGMPSGPALLCGKDERVQRAASQGDACLLGWFHDQRCVLLETQADQALAQANEAYSELRPLANHLPADVAGLLAYARALTLWRANHRYCGRCGTANASRRAGHTMQCLRCEHESFPRIDPAIIVLIHDGERALLGRQAHWPPQRYSTIAGFVEPGESLEDAVRREALEETGVQVRHVRYHSSQPWPFPASLMLGFMAEADALTPQLRDGELEDVQWLTRQQIHDGVVLLPPPEAISRQLIDQWLNGKPT